MTVSVGNIAKIMVGECPYRIWKDMRAPKEEESPQLKRWIERHEELVNFFVDEFKKENPDWFVVTDHSIELDGITGRIDILGRGKGNKFTIWEVKTGREYPYYPKQLELYVIIEQKRNPDAKIHGELRYVDHVPYNVADIDCDEVWNEALRIRDMLENDKPPQRVECDGCRWCDYRSVLHCPSI